MTEYVRVPMALSDWLYGVEGYGLRVERLSEELRDPVDKLLPWLLAAFEVGLAASPQGEGSSADADTHRAAEGVVVAGEMEGESVALMRPFWVSWWGVPGTFELHRPWWVSGERDDRMQSICAAVLAPDEFSARLSVQWAMDDKEAVIEWRFCEPKERGWSPFGSRFRRADWMRWPDTVSTAEQVGMSEANAPYRVTEGVKP